MDKSDIACRMKKYEFVETGTFFYPYIPICARIDGRSFSKFTKGLTKPYDKRLIECMVNTTKKLVEETGASIGYTQSDEISLVWLQSNINSQLFFNSRKFKMVSNIASLATIFFFKEILNKLPEKALNHPTFDCRIWQVPSVDEGVNYLIWREMDAVKNSIQLLGQSHFSHTQLHKKSCNDILDMLIDEKDINWNNEPAFFKRGTYVQRKERKGTLTDEERQCLPDGHYARTDLDFTFTRRSIQELDMLPLTKVENRIAVVFDGAEPIYK